MHASSSKSAPIAIVGMALITIGGCREHDSASGKRAYPDPANPNALDRALEDALRDLRDDQQVRDMLRTYVLPESSHKGYDSEQFWNLFTLICTKCTVHETHEYFVNNETFHAQCAIADQVLAPLADKLPPSDPDAFREAYNSIVAQMVLEAEHTGKPMSRDCLSWQGLAMACGHVTQSELRILGNEAQKKGVGLGGVLPDYLGFYALLMQLAMTYNPAPQGDYHEGALAFTKVGLLNFAARRDGETLGGKPLPPLPCNPYYSYWVLFTKHHSQVGDYITNKAGGLARLERNPEGFKSDYRRLAEIHGWWELDEP